MCAYGDGTELWTERLRTARKENRCYECNLAVPVGTRYVYVFGKQEGDVFTVVFHRECRHLAELLGDLFCGGEWAVGQLHGHLEEAGLNVETCEIRTDNVTKAAEDQYVLALGRVDYRYFQPDSDGGSYREIHVPAAARRAREFFGLDVHEIARRWSEILHRYGGDREIGGEA